MVALATRRARADVLEVPLEAGDNLFERLFVD